MLLGASAAVALAMESPPLAYHPMSCCCVFVPWLAMYPTRRWRQRANAMRVLQLHLLHAAEAETAHTARRYLRYRPYVPATRCSRTVRQTRRGLRPVATLHHCTADAHRRRSGPGLRLCEGVCTRADKITPPRQRVCAGFTSGHRSAEDRTVKRSIAPQNHVLRVLRRWRRCVGPTKVLVCSVSARLADLECSKSLEQRPVKVRQCGHAHAPTCVKLLRKRAGHVQRVAPQPPWHVQPLPDAVDAVESPLQPP